jgi:hypothetical protein
MEEFKKALEDSQLRDLGFRGLKFTWNNGQTSHGFTKERLDQAIANKEWCGFYDTMDVLVMASRCSDHNPLLISFYPPSCHRGTKCKQFSV